MSRRYSNDVIRVISSLIYVFQLHSLFRNNYRDTCINYLLYLDAIIKIHVSEIHVSRRVRYVYPQNKLW